MGEGQYSEVTAAELLEKAREQYEVFHLHVLETGAGRSRNTQDALVKLITETIEGEVVAGVVLIGVGEQWKSKERLRKIPIQVMYQVEEEEEKPIKQRWNY